MCWLAPVPLLNTFTIGAVIRVQQPLQRPFFSVSDAAVNMAPDANERGMF